MANQLKKRTASEKFFAGKRLTIADFTLVSHYLSMSHNEASDKQVKNDARKVVKKTPIVENYISNVQKAMARYMAQRPSFII